MSEKDKRVFTRKTVSLDGDIADPTGSNWFPVRLFDVSVGGIGFLTHRELRVGHVRMVRFRLPEAKADIRTIVKIVYCVKHPLFDGYRVGCQFAGLEPQALVLIEKFLG